MTGAEGPAKVHPGTVVWITGLSGAGKTTVAKCLVKLLAQKRRPAILLDGDAVRAVIQDPHVGHDPESRLQNALRICRLTRLISDQGFDVVVATMSLFREVHAWNRTNLGQYLEVYLRVDLETLAQRDPRGLYRRAFNGEEDHVVGVHLEYDEPETPDLVLENNVELDDFAVLARQILAHIQERVT